MGEEEKVDALLSELKHHQHLARYFASKNNMKAAHHHSQIAEKKKELLQQSLRDMAGIQLDEKGNII